MSCSNCSLQLCDRPSDFRAWLEGLVHEGRAARAAAAAEADAEMEDGFEVVLDAEPSHGSLGGLSAADEDATSGSTGQGPPAGEGDVADSRPAVVGLGAAVVAAEAAAAAATAAGGHRSQRRKATFHLGLAEELLAMIQVRGQTAAGAGGAVFAVILRCCLAAIQLCNGTEHNHAFSLPAPAPAGIAAGGVRHFPHQQAVGGGTAVALLRGAQ
jgi:hypothetical protein